MTPRHYPESPAETRPRRSGINVRSLTQEESQRLAERWRAIESRFAEDPRRALEDADDLVNRGLTARGYPMHQFEERAPELITDHRDVVENYRVAHTLGRQAARGKASPESMRCAMQQYRELLECVCASRLDREFRGDDTRLARR